MGDVILCAVEGCNNRKHGYIYCGKHYYKYKTHGDPLGGRRGASPGAPLKWIQDHAKYAGDDCIKWPFEVTHHGYGTIKHLGKKRVASRVMCEIAHGVPADQKMDAAHSCGNGHKACMNPRHLRWATRSENIQDAMTHGTYHAGRVKLSKTLDEGKVREIRRRIRAGEKVKDVAAAFGIGATLASRINNRHLWNWVADNEEQV